MRFCRVQNIDNGYVVRKSTFDTILPLTTYVELTWTAI